MNTLSYVIKKSGHDIYHNIVEIVAVSLIGFVIILPALFLLPIPLAIVYILFTAFPSLGAVFHTVNFMVKEKPIKFSMLFKGFKQFYLRLLLFGLIMLLLMLIPISSWWYYLKVKTMLYFTVSLFQTYFFLMIIMAFTYVLPIMICEDTKLVNSIMYSVKLFVKNPAYTIGSLIQILTVGALIAITVVSVPMLFSGILAVFTINLYDNLLLKYKKVENESK